MIGKVLLNSIVPGKTPPYLTLFVLSIQKYTFLPDSNGHPQFAWGTHPPIFRFYLVYWRERGGATWWCTELTPDSKLRGQSQQGSEDPMQCWGSNPSQTHARQMANSLLTVLSFCSQIISFLIATKVQIFEVSKIIATLISSIDH